MAQWAGPITAGPTTYAQFFTPTYDVEPDLIHSRTYHTENTTRWFSLQDAVYA